MAIVIFILSVIATGAAVYALVVSLQTKKYTRAQVDLMQEQERKREREQASLAGISHTKLKKAVASWHNSFA